MTVGNYYETSSSAPDDQVTTTTTILGVQELDKEEKYNNIKDDNHYQNDDLTMGKCHKDIVGPTAMETTTLHEYCSQVSDLIFNLVTGMNHLFVTFDSIDFPL